MTADPVSSLKGSFPGYPGRVSTKDWEEEAAPTLAKTTIMPRRPKHAPTMHILGPKLFLPVIPMSASSSPAPPASVALHQSSPNSTKTNPPQDSQMDPFHLDQRSNSRAPGRLDIKGLHQIKHICIARRVYTHTDEDGRDLEMPQV